MPGIPVSGHHKIMLKISRMVWKTLGRLSLYSAPSLALIAAALAPFPLPLAILLVEKLFFDVPQKMTLCLPSASAPPGALPGRQSSSFPTRDPQQWHATVNILKQQVSKRLEKYRTVLPCTTGRSQVGQTPNAQRMLETVSIVQGSTRITIY